MARKNKREEKTEPGVKDILELLAMGSLLAAFFVFPGLPLAFAGARRKQYYEWDRKDWERYNLGRLRRNLGRLKEQAVVKIEVEKGVPMVKLTKKGKLKVLNYSLEEMALKLDKKWDGKWRLVVYDIPTEKKAAQEALRHMLKKLKFFPLQRSVYLTPFPCEDEIDFLKEFFGVGDEVKIFTTHGFEEEEPFRRYFGL